MSLEPWRDAFQSREDLKVFGDNALALFALGLHFGIEDLLSVGATAITDGNDDKKCDLVYVNVEERYASICQCYISRKAKQAAPANKASDLNTAVGWLIHRPLRDLPGRLRAPAEELRNAVQESSIDVIHVWYVHNLPEAANVDSELKTVEAGLGSALDQVYPAINVKVRTKQVGQETLEEWYHDTQTPILVSGEIIIPIESGYQVAGPGWDAYVTTISTRVLYNQFRRHKTRLFSANIRDYLGSRQSDSNINNSIKQTLRNGPQNFWIYNNGITVLVLDFEERDRDGKRFYTLAVCP